MANNLTPAKKSMIRALSLMKEGCLHLAKRELAKAARELNKQHKAEAVTKNATAKAKLKNIKKVNESNT